MDADADEVSTICVVTTQNYRKRVSSSTVYDDLWLHIHAIKRMVATNDTVYRSASSLTLAQVLMRCPHGPRPSL
jgi:hypothetical protein